MRDHLEAAAAVVGELPAMVAEREEQVRRALVVRSEEYVGVAVHAVRDELAVGRDLRRKLVPERGLWCAHAAAPAPTDPTTYSIVASLSDFGNDSAMPMTSSPCAGSAKSGSRVSRSFVACPERLPIG